MVNKSDKETIDFYEGLKGLSPKEKAPNSLNVLNKWVSYAEKQMRASESGRLSWLVASTIVTAKLQEVIDESGKGRFLLKGGTLLQHRLSGSTRATKDLDGIVRGDFDEFLTLLKEGLEVPWGVVEFDCTDSEIINTPAKVIKPRRFGMLLKLRGKVWRKITVEISPDEGAAGSSGEGFPAPSLAGLGLPTPDELVGLSMSYQIAQKIHAVSDPHKPPEYVNDRARDVVDLLLLKSLIDATGSPSVGDIFVAVRDIFDSRGHEARELGRFVRTWPTQIVAYPHWEVDYKTAAESVGIAIELKDAVEQLNEWLESFGGRS